MSRASRQQHIENTERGLVKRLRDFAELKMRAGLTDIFDDEPITAENAHIVTDHAVIRYLERVHGIPVDRIRAHILTEQRAALIKAGAQAIKCGEYTALVKGARIATIITKVKQKK
jgi:hypothetical protein